MADSYGVQTGMMRDTTNFITENGVDNFDTASQGSRDDCVEHDAGFMEDRFRVDRKKLEQMLQLGKPFGFSHILLGVSRPVMGRGL